MLRTSTTALQVGDDVAMAYDEDLANRLRELLADEDAITEKKMFGGLAFLLHGNMAVSASGQGGLLARIDPADTEAALARPHASLMEMGKRSMQGKCRISAARAVAASRWAAAPGGSSSSSCWRCSA